IATDNNRTKIEIAEINASVKEDINRLNQQVDSVRHIADILTQRYGIAVQADTANQDRTAAGAQADQDRAVAESTADKDRLAASAATDPSGSTDAGSGDHSSAAADVMGEVHASKPVTDEDKVMS